MDKPKAKTGTAETDARDGEFDKFEDLTRKLVTIPKKKLDEARARESQNGKAKP